MFYGGKGTSTVCTSAVCMVYIGKGVCYTVAMVHSKRVWCTAANVRGRPLPAVPLGTPFYRARWAIRVQILLLISRELVAAKSCRPCSPPRDPESRPCTPSCDVVAVAGASRERQRPSTPLQVRFHPSKSPGTGATLPGC